MVAAAWREIEPLGERGGGESLLAASPLLLEEFIMRGRADGEDGGSELRSGAIAEYRNRIRYMASTLVGVDVLYVWNVLDQGGEWRR